MSEKKELKCKTKGCNNPVLTNFGYKEFCIYCERKKLMELSNEEIADELGREIFPHKSDWVLKEAIRRILLRA